MFLCMPYIVTDTCAIMNSLRRHSCYTLPLEWYEKKLAFLTLSFFAGKLVKTLIQTE